MHILPIILMGGAIAIFSKRKKRKKKSPASSSIKSLPEGSSLGRGAIFEGDTESRPSGINAKPGERFSIEFYTNPSLLGEWSLKASPPDNSVLQVGKEHDEIVSQDLGGITGKDVYIFEGSKPGKGSLVFHWQQPALEGKEPPEKIVEILTEIS